MHVAFDRQVRGAGCEVLADGQHVDVVGAHVAHHVQNFFVGFTQAHHQATFGGHVREQGLEFFQQVQGELVIAAGARFFVQARHGFQVVVHHIGRCGFQNLQGAVVAAPKVGHQNFNLRVGRQGACFADAVHKVLAAAVAQVVAVHAGDDHVAQPQLGNGFGQVVGFVHIQRVGPAVADIAKRATPGAFVTHDHESGRALAKAFANIRAGGLFTDGHQLVGAQHVFDFIKAGAGAARFDANPVGLFQHLAGDYLDRNARELGPGLLLGGWVVVLNAGYIAHGV